MLMMDEQEQKRSTSEAQRSKNVTLDQETALKKQLNNNTMVPFP
jgi:hypothetical protein